MIAKNGEEIPFMRFLVLILAGGMAAASAQTRRWCYFVCEARRSISTSLARYILARL